MLSLAIFSFDLRFKRKIKLEPDVGFLPRDAVLVQYMMLSCVRLSVRPFVRTSHAAIVTKRLNLGSRKQCRKIAQGL